MNHRLAANPFRATQAEAWAEPLDVPSINKDVSDSIATHIDGVRSAGAQRDAALRSTSVLLLGPAGSGKTHLFARLRKQVGARAVFILSRPELGAEPAPRHVLAAIVDSLRLPVAGEEHRQIDLIAGAMLATLGQGKPRYPFLFLDDLKRQPLAGLREQIERAVEQAADRFPDISEEYLERLLWLPFRDCQDQRALFAWLAGREPNPIELDCLGAAGAIADMDVMRALRTLGVAAAYGAPLVLVFDQLENLGDDGKTGRILAYARLVSELRDTVRGLVIVQMALDSEWATRIDPVLHGSDRARLEETVKRLALPTPQERRALIERWWEALPEEEREKPFPHPFSAAAVELWTKTHGMTPRMLMQACGEAYLMGGTPVSLPPRETDPVSHDARLKLQWEQALERGRIEIDEAAAQERGVAAERIRGGLIAALGRVGGQLGVPGAKVLSALHVTWGGASKDVVIAQHPHPSSLCAAIRNATELAAARPVVLLRERAFGIPPTWKEVGRLLSAFAATPGAAYAPIDREDLARLLALADFLGAARSQDLSADDGRPIPHADVVRWAEATLECATWGPLKAILGAPARADSTPAPPPAAALTPQPPLPAAGREGAGAAPLRSEPPLSPRGERGVGGEGPVRAILDRLRVASIERLVREAKAVDPAATRATVTGELDRLPIRTFGDSIVTVGESWS